MYPTPSSSNGSQGHSNWNVSARVGTAPGKLSSLLGINNPTMPGSSQIAGSIDKHPFPHSSGMSSRGGAVDPRAKANSIQRTLAEQTRNRQAVIAGALTDRPGRTQRVSTAMMPPVHQRASTGVGIPPEENFVMEAKLAAADAQMKQYREKIINLERQLQVSLAQNKSFQSPQQQQSNLHGRSMSAFQGTASLTSSPNTTTPIDHFPLPPSTANTFNSTSNSSTKPLPNFPFARSPNLNSPYEEAKQSPIPPPSTAPSNSGRPHRLSNPTSIFPAPPTASSGFSIPPATGNAPATSSESSSLETASLHAQIAGLNQLLDEYEVLFAKQGKEVKALRKENEKLNAQLALAHNLTGLLEKVENDEAQAKAAADAVLNPFATASTTTSPTNAVAANRQEEHKDHARFSPVSSSPSTLGNAAKYALNNPNVISSGVTNMLKQSLGGVQAAPQWLIQLMEYQQADPKVMPPHQYQDHLNHHQAGQGVTSVISTPQRVEARGKAFKYIISTLSPHLNVRDRAVTVLLEEFMKEHAWLSSAFTSQLQLIAALVDYVHKKDLGLDSNEEKQVGMEFLRRQEYIQQVNEQQRVAQMVQQQALQMLRTQTSHMSQHNNLTLALTPHGGAPMSGLVPGSAGSITRFTAIATTPSSGFSATPTPLNSAKAKAAYAPVQVDGGGSHNISMGTEWLPTDDSGERPFRDLPELPSTEEELLTHPMRYVMASGIDVPLSAIRIEKQFWQQKNNQHKGYSDTPGGIANKEPRGVENALISPSVANSSPEAAANFNVTSPINMVVPPSPANNVMGVNEQVEADEEAERQRQNRPEDHMRESFRVRDGTHQIPASVRKWASVDQLDYVTSTEYSADSSSRKPRVRTTKRAPSGKSHERGASRSYTQTALGALSESVPETEEDLNFELVDPFAPPENLEEAGSAVVLQREKEEQDRREREEAEKHAQASSLNPIHRLGLKSGASDRSSSSNTLTPLSIPPTPNMLGSMMSPAAAPYSNTPSASPPVTTQFVFNVPPTPSVALSLPLPPPPMPLPPPPSAESRDPTQPPSGTSSFSVQSEYVPLGSLKSLYDLLKFISFKLNHQQQLKHVVHAVRRLVGSDRVTLWFVDHFRQHIWSTIGTAVTNEIRVKLGVGIAGGVAASGKSVTMTNATYDQRFLKKVESGTDYITKAVICVPLKTPRNQTFAVLQIMNKERTMGNQSGSSSAASGGYFTRTDELLSHIVCQHLAQNLWGSEMFQVGLREKLKTQLVFKHAETLLSCLDVKEMLASLVNRIRMLMDADYAVLFALSTSKNDPDENASMDHTVSNNGGGNGNGSSSSGGSASSRPGSRQRGVSRGGKRSKGTLGNPMWGEEKVEPPKEELLTITESCTPQIAIIIPQGFQSDRRSEGFKFNAIRVPLSSGGIAAQTVKSGKVTNIFDTRLDKRFNPLLDEYISDNSAAGGGGAGRSSHCTRSFVALPIMSQANFHMLQKGKNIDPKSIPEIDGVLVLGKLIPKPFQTWEIAELDELRNILYMGVRRYRSDRVMNLRMHDRLTSINRMVGNLDLENGGNGVVLPLGGSEEGTEEDVVQALAKGAVIVTEEGAASIAGKMKDPETGELLPSLAEFQRSRMMFPPQPQLGSTLADAFYKHEVSRVMAAGSSLGGSRNITRGNSLSDLLAPSRGDSGITLNPVIASSMPFFSSRSSTMDLPMNAPQPPEVIDEDEMRDPSARKKKDPNAINKPSAAKDATNANPAMSIELQREGSDESSGIAQHPPENEAEEIEDDEGIFSNVNNTGSGQSKKKTNAGLSTVKETSPPLQPLKPIDYSKSTFHTPDTRTRPLMPPVPPAAGTEAEVAAATATSAVPPASSVPEDGPPVPITQYKVAPVALFPPVSSESPIIAQLDEFHQSTVSAVSSKRDSAPVAVFNDSAGSGFGIAPSSGNLSASHGTVSRIALHNMTDIPEIDASKNVTYKH